MDIEQYTHRFYAYLLAEKRVSKNTFCAYRSDIEQLLAFFSTTGIAQMEDITYQSLQQFLTVLHGQKVGARSVVRKLSAMKLFFGYAHERFQIPNPSIGMTFPKVEKKLPQFLTEDEIRLLLSTVDSLTGTDALRTQCIIYTLYITGLRVTELVNLTLADIFLDRRCITVKGKGGKQRVVPIPPVLHDKLVTFMHHTTEASHGTALQRRSSHTLFYCHDDKGMQQPLNRFYIGALLKRVWKKTGNMKKISPHTLRHSFATHFLKNGLHLRSLQMILGHENIGTVQIYTHIETSYLAAIYQKKHPRS